MAVEFKLIKKKNKYFRLDVLPFIIIYSMIIYVYNFSVEEEIFGRLILLIILLLHIITYLCSHWSVRFKIMSQFQQSKEITNASHVSIIKSKINHKNIYDISEIHIKHKKQKQFYVLYFQNKKYIYNEDKKQFFRLKALQNLTIDKYLDLKLNYHENNREYFEENDLIIPMKQFGELLKDQLLEPFSFFQFFSVSLWLMDENRFYSLMTLVMLFMTSCTVVLQRIRTMMTLRQMKLNSCYVNVLENNKWVKTQSNLLKPGDIIEIESSSCVKPYEDIHTQEKEEKFYKDLVPFSHKLPEQFFRTEQMNTQSYKKLQCDIVMIEGNCIVDESILTGESIPQIKDQLEKKESNRQLSIKNTHKNNILYCGTEVLQTFNENGKCLGRVLRTGFDTSKGKLIRTVLFNNENINIKQYDAYILIFILLILSILSSSYVLYQGLQDPTRDRNKLFLRCILIITTVVPPELPMILTIAVNGSLMYLQGKKIFCSEPFRIPMAGQCQLLAFDKTGTLTLDQLKFKGIVQSTDLNYLKDLKNINLQVSQVMAGCHSLLVQNREVMGDPLEKLFFEISDWTYSNIDKTSIQKNTKSSVKIRKIFYFKSELKRMTTLVECNDPILGHQFKVLTKGAPETIDKLLEVPVEGYQECYRSYAQMGMRVLALASRKISKEELNIEDREFFEQKLKFEGFLICESPLKWDTKQNMQALQSANFQIIIITGDNLLTAIAVSKDLKLNNSYPYLQITLNHQQQLTLQNINQQLITTFEHNVNDKLSIMKSIISYSQTNNLSIDGECLQHLIKDMDQTYLRQILCKITVFARTSPQQKEFIVQQLRELNIGVLMCGDGTNDVGALKKADVGIALVGLKNEDEASALERKQQKRMRKEEQKRMNLNQQRQHQQMNMSELLGEEYKFGDACIAAPFTSKVSSSIKCVLQVLKQGICTQVTSIQTYKILTLTSIIQAYSFTMLHLQSLKFSESQSTIQGILVTVNYFYFSNNKPLKTIAKQRPPKTIFEPYFIISILLQLFIHLYGMELAFSIGQKYDQQQVNHDEEFKPTFLNTVAFFVNFVSQQCIFLFNHGGLPFSTPLSQNKKYLKWLIYPLVASLLISQNVNDDINWFLQLHYQNVPQQALSELFMVMFSMISLNYLVEFTLKFLKYRQVYDYI